MKISSNRKAFYEYFILEEFNCGIVLLGSEVKSIRQGNLTMQDSFAYIKDNEVWVKNLKVSRYKQVHLSEPHDENREKKLLLNRKEINKIIKHLQDKGTTLIPLEIFVLRNKIKVKIGIAKGKKLWDKKEKIKNKDLIRQMKVDLS